MLLSARILQNCINVNSYELANEASITEGDPVTVTLQLLDKSLDTDQNPPGRRYVPASGATLMVAINPIDNAAKVLRTATQPFPGDLSIWQFQILATDPLRGTLDIKLSLTEGVVVRTGVIRYGLSITPANQSFMKV